MQNQHSRVTESPVTPINSTQCNGAPDEAQNQRRTRQGDGSFAKTTPRSSQMPSASLLSMLQQNQTNRTQPWVLVFEPTWRPDRESETTSKSQTTSVTAPNSTVQPDVVGVAPTINETSNRTYSCRHCNETEIAEEEAKERASPCGECSPEEIARVPADKRGLLSGGCYKGRKPVSAPQSAQANDTNAGIINRTEFPPLTQLNFATKSSTEVSRFSAAATMKSND